MSPEIIITDDKGRTLKKIIGVSATQLFSVGMDIWRQNKDEVIKTGDDEAIEYFKKMREISEGFGEACFKIKRKKK